MKKYLIGLSALLAMGVAFASGDNFMAKPASYAAAGTVIGIDVGWGWSNLYLNGSDTGNTRDNYYGMVDGGAYIGYNFHPTTNLLMGVELGYKFLGYSSDDNFGDNDRNSYSASMYQNVADLLFTAHYYVYKGWNMFGKIGVAGTFQTDPYLNENSDESETNFRLLPEYAVGIGYTWNQKLDLHLTYDHVGSAENNGLLGPVVSNGDDAFESNNSIMLGISYTFPSGL
jgi:hypothetical protein